MTGNNNKKTLLIVEDEVLIAMSEKAELEKYGYTVVIAHTGEEAVELFNEDNDINLILMDINLGNGIDGTEAARKILGEHDIPIVFLSSHTSPEIVEKTEKITSYGYVVKNSGITVLDASIKMAFRLFDEKQKVKEHQDKISKNEEKLLKSERELDETIEFLPVAIGILDSHGNILRVNQKFTEIFGYTISEIPTIEEWKSRAYPDPEYRERSFFTWDNDIQKAIENGTSTPSREYTINCNDGSTRDVIITFKPGNSRHLTTFVDITMRKELEKQIRESEERLSLAMDASEHGFWDWNLETNDIYFSPHHYKMLKFEPGYLKNRNESWMDIVHPEDKELVLPEILDNIHKGKPYSVELRMRKGDGSWKWLLSRGKSYEFSSEGKPTRAVGVYLDIDEYKQTENEKRKIQERFTAIFENELMCL